MENRSWQSVVLAALSYALSAVAVIAATIVSFIVFMLLLADTPLHNGDELPGVSLLSIALILSLFVGGIIAAILYNHFRNRRSISVPGSARAKPGAKR